jgi:uncharacterized protein (DUF2141 family)
MPSVTIDDPTNNAHLPTVFPASGEYSTAALESVSKVPDYVLSIVKDSSGNKLDEQMYGIPAGVTSGEWNVEHSVGDGTYSDCSLTAELYIQGSKEAQAKVTGLTIG